jgi:hypothetical protein
MGWTLGRVAQHIRRATSHRRWIRPMSPTAAFDRRAPNLTVMPEIDLVHGLVIADGQRAGHWVVPFGLTAGLDPEERSMRHSPFSLSIYSHIARPQGIPATEVSTY